MRLRCGCSRRGERRRRRSVQALLSCRRLFWSPMMRAAVTMTKEARQTLRLKTKVMLFWSHL